MEFKCGKVPIKSLLIQSPARSLEKRGTVAYHETGGHLNSHMGDSVLCHQSSHRAS